MMILVLYFILNSIIPSLQVMKKSAKQVMLTEVAPKDLEFDYSSLQTLVAERVADMSSMARAAAPALIPLSDGFVLIKSIN